MSVENDFTAATLAVQISRLRKKLESKTDSEVSAALEEVCDLGWKVGTEIQSLEPQLLRLLSTCPLQSEEALKYCFHHIGSGAVSSLQIALADGRALVRRRAVTALGQIGESALSTESTVLQLVRDEVIEVRLAAIFALGQMYAKDAETISELAKLCTIGSIDEVRAAIHAIGVIGKNQPISKPSINLLYPLIAELMKGEDSRVRRWSLYVLESVSLEPLKRREALLRCLEKETDTSCMAALFESLKSIAHDCDLTPAIGTIVYHISNVDDASAIRSACKLLVELGKPARDAIPVLTTLLKTEHALAAAEALWSIERNPQTIVPTLIAEMEYSAEEVCDLAYTMGASARALLPNLIEVLQNEDYWDTQWAAADAISRVAIGDPSVIPLLLDTLNHSSSRIRSAASRGLAAAGREALKPLLAIAQSDTDKRVWAIYALGEMGPIAAEAAPALRTHLISKDQSLSDCTAIALAKISRDANLVKPLLDILMRVDDDSPQIAVIGALGEIGPEAESAIDLLEHIQETMGGTEFGNAADEALQKIQQSRIIQ
jgi:HEAT repeat protein